MKVQITQAPFMKFWNMAEKITSPKNSMPSLSCILCVAKDDGEVILSSTDLKTTIRLKAEGADVLTPGSALLPTKVVGELFKKITVSPFTVEVKELKGLIKAGRNRYHFTTYPVNDFPELPSPQNATTFAKVKAGELSRVLEEGSIAGAPNEEFPKYLSGALLQVQNGELRIASTDGRRLSLSKTPVNTDDMTVKKNLLLPLISVGEFQKIVQSFSIDEEVEILEESSVVFFKTSNMDFSVRRIESSFPNYEKILGVSTTTQMQVLQQDFLTALDRINIVVRDSSRIVLLNLNSGSEMKMSGRAPEVGEAHENVDATINGESLKVAFNVGFLMEGLKAFRSGEVRLSFNGSEGQMTIMRVNGAEFIYMLMPIKIRNVDLSEETFSDEDSSETSSDNNKTQIQ